ncbi:MAG: RagB/SusD family nutrient uptake outer membrane protein [Sphingobacteriaceae bacterium]|nr:RagB/SusD family nutrient uptake outer membrane protein [Sphingobacteriaceae bacterium]
MKKKIILSLISVLVLTASCNKDFLDLKPIAVPGEIGYFTTSDHFKSASNAFYNKMIGFNSVDGSNFYDWTGSRVNPGVVVSADNYWRNPWMYIRHINILLEKGENYQGDKAAIKQYISAANFFRAWQYFFLLKRYGGVPIITKSLTVADPLLYAPRNTRYEVVDQILKDLDAAIEGLPLESVISASDKGHLSKQAAKAFKARVLLYEATWEKYVGETTDFAPGQKKADNVTAYLTQAASLAKEIMDDATYQLWNGSGNWTYYYFFVLEDGKSNPNNLTKTSNKEFILKRMYDYDLARAGANLSHTLGGATSGLDREMMDSYLMTDGLPYTHSPLRKGYNKMTDEFDNRDLRLFSLVKRPGQKYWGRGAGVNGGGADYAKANYTTINNWPTNFNYTFLPNLTALNTGYVNRKWVTEHPLREDNQESYDYPLIRLAEMYLIYAEAKCELGGGTISDADLDISINKIRARAGVAKLTNALIVPYPDLTMLGEIRRERNLELYLENFRVDDIKRWAIAETVSNKAILGMVVKNADGTPTEVATYTVGGKAIYNPAAFPNGVDVATGAVIVQPASSIITRRDYLSPIPTDQINLNPNLKPQNSGY